MHIVSNGDNLHEMSNLLSGKNKKNILRCRLLKMFPSMLSVNAPCARMFYTVSKKV